MRMPKEDEEAAEQLRRPHDERTKAVVDFERNYSEIGKPFKDRAIACFDTEEEAVEHAKDVNLHSGKDGQSFWDKVRVYAIGVDDIIYIREADEEEI